jgi:hypothetical protein
VGRKPARGVMRRAECADGKRSVLTKGRLLRAALTVSWKSPSMVERFSSRLMPLRFAMVKGLEGRAKLEDDNTTD